MVLRDWRADHPLCEWQGIFSTCSEKIPDALSALWEVQLALFIISLLPYQFAAIITLTIIVYPRSWSYGS